MTTAALVNAVLALLNADAQLTVYDGAPPDGASPPYVVVYADSGLWSRPQLAGASDEVVLKVWTHSVGLSSASARAVADHVRDVLLDAVVAVNGWAVSPITHDGPAPARTDPDLGFVVVDAIDAWRLYATLV